MKKTYIKPSSKAYNINLSESLLVTVSGGEKVENPTDFSGSTETPTGGTVDGEYGRSNSNNIWSEEW